MLVGVRKTKDQTNKDESQSFIPWPPKLKFVLWLATEQSDLPWGRVNFIPQGFEPR